MEFSLAVNLIIFAGSLLVLLKGSDWFVEAAEVFGLAFGINSFIIGVTIVAIGTSLPELTTSIAAVYSNDTQIVIGNVVGSNITNILLILGIVALYGNVVPLEYDIMDVDMPLLVASSLFLYFALEDLEFSLFEAILFLVAFVGFILHSVKSNKFEDIGERPKATYKTYLMFVAGGALIYFGSKYVVFGLQGMSVNLGIGSGILAFTLLALGTSLPEVVVSITAARKGKAGMAIGNVLGSNLFNTYAVMGIPALISDLEIPASALQFAVPFMIAVTVLFALITFSGRINRYEGLILLLFYIFFLYKMSTSVL